jgi:hypothetical protein
MSASELPDPISRFVEVVNQGNTESFLDFFPTDGVVEDSGRSFVGQNAIRQWSNREFIGAKGHMTVTGIEKTKNGISVTADSLLRGRNLHPQRSSFLLLSFSIERTSTTSTISTFAYFVKRSSN